MKIYFGASISLDRSLLPTYQKIVSQLKQQGHAVLSEYVVDPKLVVGDGLSPKQLFARETKTIEEADVMIAEVSVPSWGTAFLIEHALEHNKPVLALFYKDAKDELPMMIEGHPDLYVQHYDEDNIDTILKKSLKHFSQMKSRRGKLIVIDGGDGAGKATQTQLLIDYLKARGCDSNYIAFPRYKTSFHGHHVGRFLTGEFGGNTEVSPYLSSLAFALDRLTARDEIVEWLTSGHYVIADRYVSASMAHQGSKLSGEKQKDFLNWLSDMEYKEHRLPREDIVLFLYVPVETAQKLLNQVKAKGLAGGKDQAETDLDHQRRSIEMYRDLSKKYRHWEMVECVDDQGQLLSKEEIHQKILAILRKRSILK
jgi:dTMP kinase